MKRGRNAKLGPNVEVKKRARIGVTEHENVKEAKDEEEILKNIKIHPLLQMPLGTQKMGQDDNDISDKKRSSKTVPKIKNPLLSDWKQRDGFTINPYIDQSDLSIVPERKSRALRINEPGKQIERANNLRQRAKQERLELEHQEELKKKNLVPDERIGEDRYGDEFAEPPPYIEWWDVPFLKNGMRRGCRYEGCGEEVVTYKDENSEDNPITSYIQHPVPIEAPWERLIPTPKPLFLTKQEQKRLRKNRRMLLMKEKQDRIKLGLDAAPKPKVKLKNLMNVLTNETIRNPTEVEMRVRQEIQERADEHERMNAERKLNKEERRHKVEQKVEQDRSRGIYSCVFVVQRLVNPKHLYKVDMNAKQLMLTGACLRLRRGRSLVIVEGGLRGVEKYKSLMMRRINWTANESPRTKDGDSPTTAPGPGPALLLEDLSDNRCDRVWEGEVPEARFHKWTEYTFESDEAIIEFLSKYKLENYWRQSVYLEQEDA
ncbi:hypothetical protein PICMEDRAFT_171878 [Pichia membranifaciens NRRL Y-2026]|uniref:Uncharacterized protein n=1 Tax=Pichia membranifaciens NRRL Y-2026 TaxID=763406 RepID=A0A1E3NII8_9ASCO|nr:hypothetical protein PICMEDRAFT_171878 [Pichia membranifaciens NRRL Y-2026]ODQ45398.1 hypothetical protein PICMEDRAFT_171878 [Pichia membranifaciens NRRL Y-2026]